jgi:AcrR family transcriptional regulator
MPRPARAASPTAAPDRSGPTAGGGTRAQIQQVAFELFTEQGYEATSLREIAERLGVTKAALYYHFKTKDEIVQSLLHDQTAKLDGLLEWGQQLPRTAQARREFLHRYAEILFDGDTYIRFMRFLDRNQSSAQKLHAGAAARERMSRMQAILTPPDASLAQQLRYSLALIALHSSWFTLRGPDITDEQRQRTAVEVALTLLD